MVIQFEKLKKKNPTNRPIPFGKTGSGKGETKIFLRLALFYLQLFFLAEVKELGIYQRSVWLPVKLVR